MSRDLDLDLDLELSTWPSWSTKAEQRAVTIPALTAGKVNSEEARTCGFDRHVNFSVNYSRKNAVTFLTPRSSWVIWTLSIIWTPSSFSIVHTRKGFGKAGAAVQWKEIRLPSTAFLEVASAVVEMVTKEGRWWTGTRRKADRSPSLFSAWHLKAGLEVEEERYKSQDLMTTSLVKSLVTKLRTSPSSFLSPSSSSTVQVIWAGGVQILTHIIIQIQIETITNTNTN